MFNNFLKNLKSNNLNLNNNELSNLQNLKEIKQTEVKKRDELNKETYENYCKKGIEAFKLFAKTKNNNELKISCENFINALEIKKNYPEPYFYLSYAALLAGDLEICQRYYQITQSIEPEFIGLKVLREQIETKKINI